MDLKTNANYPYVGARWPPGHILGHEHTYAHTDKGLLDGIAAREDPPPTFEDSYRCQAMLDAGAL